MLVWKNSITEVKGWHGESVCFSVGLWLNQGLETSKFTLT